MKIRSIIKKDLMILLSDKKALIIMLLMPIILMVILGFALKGIFTESWVGGQVNIAVVKQYNAEADRKSFDDALHSGLLAQGMGTDAAAALSTAGGEMDPERIFFDDFLESSEVSDILSYRIESEQKAKELLADNEVSAIVLLPEKYLYNMKINLITPFRNELELKVLTSPDATMNGQIVKSIMQAYSDSMSSAIIGKNVLIESAMANNLGSGSFHEMDAVMAGIMDALKAVRVEVDDITLEGRRAISSSNYYAAAMLAMFILFAAGHGGRMLLEEKEDFTLQRMTVAGTSKLGILTGKFLVVFLIALLQIALMTAFSHLILKVEWGDLSVVTGIGIAAAVAVAGVGSFLAAITFQFGNYKVANVFETGIIQIMALLGGSFVPVDILPNAFQTLSVLSLNGIVLKAYQKTMMGYGWDAVQGYITALTGIGIIFTFIAAVLLMRREGTPHVKHYQVKNIKA